MFESICFLITSKCNMRCPYCYRIESKKEYIELEDFEKSLLKLKQGGSKIINITGGEPLLHPYWRECIEIANQLGFVTNFSTNTLLLHLDDGILPMLNLLTISCDGVEDAGLRNRDIEQFNKSISILQEFNKKKFPFRLKVNTVITRSNINNIESFALRYLDNCNIVWMLFPYSRKGTYNNMAKELEVDNNEFIYLIKRLQHVNLKCHIMFEHMQNILLDKNSYYMVNVDADMYVSVQNEDYKLGNVLNDSIRQIENRAKKLNVSYEFTDYTEGKWYANRQSY